MTTYNITTPGTVGQQMGESVQSSERSKRVIDVKEGNNAHLSTLSESDWGYIRQSAHESGEGINTPLCYVELQNGAKVYYVNFGADSEEVQSTLSSISTVSWLSKRALGLDQISDGPSNIYQGLTQTDNRLVKKLRSPYYFGSAAITVLAPKLKGIGAKHARLNKIVDGLVGASGGEVFRPGELIFRNESSFPEKAQLLYDGKLAYIVGLEGGNNGEVNLKDVQERIGKQFDGDYLLGCEYSLSQIMRPNTLDDRLAVEIAGDTSTDVLSIQHYFYLNIGQLDLINGARNLKLVLNSGKYDRYREAVKGVANKGLIKAQREQEKDGVILNLVLEAKPYDPLEFTEELQLKVLDAYSKAFHADAGMRDTLSVPDQSMDEETLRDIMIDPKSIKYLVIDKSDLNNPKVVSFLFLNSDVGHKAGVWHTENPGYVINNSEIGERRDVAITLTFGTHPDYQGTIKMQDYAAWLITIVKTFGINWFGGDLSAAMGNTSLLSLGKILHIDTQVGDVHYYCMKHVHNNDVKEG
ncbi:MAG: hypothetical protein QY318_02140 [Candidatus Dojkabacteria bacterium]|nr:MAG: hypothetical protein QY318_02140 [Candidatus Dojkabacteria bacterium]